MVLSVYAVLSVVVLAGFIKAATSMFFTWTVKGNELQLISKLTLLNYNISIFDENGITRASCLFPSLFEPICGSDFHNAQISQNIKTNTTILTLWKGGVNNGSCGGIWTWRRGRGKEAATTKVTVPYYFIKATSMFFTWTVKGNELQLICKLTQLNYDISIIDENGIEWASCLFPSLFEPKCVSYFHNAQISQNIKTNTTILTIWKGVNDGSFDGIWTCRHGRGKEEATTKVTDTDSTSMFFTWTVKGNELQLICKLTQLNYDVSIIDENGIEWASCLFPSLFEPKCVSYFHNAQISQNIKTNTTILTIWKGVNDGSFDGIWTCRHGRGKEEETTKVADTDYSNAFDKNTKWTFIGMITTCLLLNTAIVIHSLIRCSEGCCSETKPSCHDKRSKKVRKAIMWCICLILIALLSAIPIYLDYLNYLDYLGKSMPFPAQFFIADGFIIGVSCHMMSNISVRTDNVSDESEKCEHNRSEEPDPNLTENNDETPLFETSGHEMESNESTSKDSQSKIRDAHCTIM